MLENYDEQFYQEAVDSLDVKYIDGIAYMSIHTIDIINESMMSTIDKLNEFGINGEQVPEGLTKGAFWVMMIWQQLHDELDIRAEVSELPDTIEGLTDLD